jgi:hypothetical protein
LFLEILLGVIFLNQSQFINLYHLIVLEGNCNASHRCEIAKDIYFCPTEIFQSSNINRSISRKVPKVGAGTYVARGSYLIGDVVVGEKSTIWFGSVLRGDENYIRVGNHTSIQDNAT